MRPIPAIVEPAPVDVDLCEQQILVALAGERDAETAGKRYQQQADAARATAKARRLEVGRLLVKARAAWPERGPRAKGWGEFLQRLGIADSTARMYMDEYRDPQGFAEKRRDSAKTPTPDEPVEASDRDVRPDNGVDQMAEPAAAPPPTSATPEQSRDLGFEQETGQEAEAEAMLAARESPPAAEASPSPEPAQEPDPDPDVEIDRDTWCTPWVLTNAIGEVDRDPCANERSHVQARETFRLEYGQDGLALAQTVDPDELNFINPPYSKVWPWVKAYGHTRFIFLLKFDPSTRWFAELVERTELILIPRGTRVQFEAPPGVPPEKSQANQFPHALFYARAADATPEILAMCFAWRVERGARAA